MYRPLARIAMLAAALLGQGGTKLVDDMMIAQERERRGGRAVSGMYYARNQRQKRRDARRSGQYR